MKYVLNCSVALKWALPEADSPRAASLRDAGHDLHAPDIFPVEIGNALSKLSRQRRISEAIAIAAFTEILSTGIVLHSSADLLPRAFELSLDTRCSLYDALYVALAELEQCQVVTADELLVRNLNLHLLALLDTVGES